MQKYEHNLTLRVIRIRGKILDGITIDLASDLTLQVMRIKEPENRQQHDGQAI